MEFDDLDDPFKAPSKPSRFGPKSSRFQPKTKQSTASKAEMPVVVVKKEEDSHARMDIDKEREIAQSDRRRNRRREKK